jgi:hypothetical protein
MVGLDDDRDRIAQCFDQGRHPSRLRFSGGLPCGSRRAGCAAGPGIGAPDDAVIDSFDVLLNLDMA